tara:strand:+ start:1026 stop:1481 length:456 start_codon:yes stop_codon:yes gene_type:complete
MTGKPRDPVPSASVDFEAAACKRTARPAKKKTPPPFSLRLSPEERARLEAAAAGEPLGAFIRRKVFEEDPSLRARRRRAPVKDHAALAQTLGMLGHMRIANNLNQLARAANIGALPLTREVEEDLSRACAAVLAMKAELMRALGYPAELEE